MCFKSVTQVGVIGEGHLISFLYINLPESNYFPFLFVSHIHTQVPFSFIERYWQESRDRQKMKVDDYLLHWGKKVYLGKLI